MANLITLQQYKDFTGIKGVNEDAKINVIVPAISQAVKTYCGTSFIDHYSSDKTEFFDIKDKFTTAVMVDESPLISVSQVQERQSQSDAYVAESARASTHQTSSEPEQPAQEETPTETIEEETQSENTDQSSNKDVDNKN